ncbi:MAG: ABC transporter substrate-binding protein [Halanaerobiales bacterium]
MRRKRGYIPLLVIMIAILIGLLSMGTVFAAEEELIDPDIPESWYEAPQTASEVNIEKLNQSPMLDDRVEEGELPPVEERLPVDPAVTEPYEGIGNYGGTMEIWDIDLDGVEYGFMNPGPSAANPTPDGDKVPFYVEGWELAEDYKSMTLYLREGVKWSDGEPLTADDYLYWWEHVANNEDLSPVAPEDWKPGLLDVTKEDDFTVVFDYDREVPNRPLYLSLHMGADYGLGPAHYMEQFHPDFVDKEEITEMAEDVGLERWDEYYGRIQDDSPTHPEYDHQRPVLTPYIVTERSENTLKAERNPYYPFIDSAGNQLPYIDKLRVNLANETEMASTKAATGEATFAARHLSVKNIPLYKRNEGNENYTTYLYNRAFGSEITIQLNQGTKDDSLRPVFQDLRFRKALSLAINRENINDKVYFGEGVPRQASVLPTHELYKEEYGKAYAEYDPDRAEELLDEMGMVDVNDDGYRETPDGEEFNPNFIYCKLGAVDPTSALELINSTWKDIGINIDLKMVSRELHDTRWEANEADISAWTTDQIVGDWTSANYGLRFFSPVAQPTFNQWPGWTNWYLTDGEEGVEPPEEVKELIEHAETAMYTTDQKKRDEARTKLYDSQAENLWMIGTVGLGPQPIIAKNNLKNIPKTGLWDALLSYLEPYRQDQFYLEE